MIITSIPTHISGLVFVDIWNDTVWYCRKRLQLESMVFLGFTPNIRNSETKIRRLSSSSIRFRGGETGVFERRKIQASEPQTVYYQFTRNLEY